MGSMISSVEDFMEQANPELAQIYAYALNASLYEQGPCEELEDDAFRSDFSLRTKVLPEEELLLIRVSGEFKARHWEARIDYVAEYHVEETEVSEVVLVEFVNRSVMMCLFPYIRSALADLTAKLPAPTFTLPLIHPGEVSFAAHGDAVS